MKQDEAYKLARQLLDPEHFTKLLLDRSCGNLGRAMSMLLSAMSDLRQQQIADEELGAVDLETIEYVDAEQAFRMLIEHFGDQRIYDIVTAHLGAAQYGVPNNVA